MSRTEGGWAERATFYGGHSAWLDARRAASVAPTFRLGATAAGKILGVSPWGGPWAVYADAMVPGPPLQGAHLRAGHRAEPFLLGWYREERDAEIVAAGSAEPFTVAHPRHPWLCVSPDAVVSRDGSAGLVEIKTSRYRDGWGRDRTTLHALDEWALSQIPPHYLCQVYAQLAATGLPWCDVVVGFAFHDIRAIRVVADIEYQARLVAALAEWRERHLVGGEAPEIDDSAACMQAQQRRPREGERAGTAEELGLARAYSAARIDEQDAQQSKRMAASLLGDSMGDDKTLTFPGGGRATMGARGLRITRIR